MSDSKVAEMNILKPMAVLGLATATSLLLFLKGKAENQVMVAVWVQRSFGR